MKFFQFVSVLGRGSPFPDEVLDFLHAAASRQTAPPVQQYQLRRVEAGRLRSGEALEDRQGARQVGDAAEEEKEEVAGSTLPEEQENPFAPLERGE